MEDKWGRDLVNVNRPSVFANGLEVGFYPPTENERDSIFLNGYISKGP